jgi:protein FRG1
MDPLRKKSNKLSFKGDKPKKKKKSSSEKTSKQVDNDGPKEGWTFAEEMDDLIGPITISFPSDTPVTFQTNEMSILKPKVIPESEGGLSNFEPSTVAQVFTGQRIIDSTKFNFKTCYSKYLSCDKFGVVTAHKEAIGPQEEWTIVMRPDGVCFQSVYDKFLTFDEETQKLKATDDYIGFNQTFKVRCQNEVRFNRRQATKKSNEDVKLTEDLEDEVGQKYMSFTGKRKKLGSGLEELRKAKDEGKLNEALLDRRSKVKSDKFCM